MRIDAQYNQHQVKEFNTNPLTSAIPVFTDKKSVLSTLTVLPSIGENYWDLPEVYQQTELLKLDLIHVPVPQLYALYNKFMSLILHAYSLYNPLSPVTNKLQLDIAKAARENVLFTDGHARRTTANSVLVSGHSGTGKTTTIRAGLSLIPQVIEHESFDGKPFKQDQLVWVSFDLPATSSIKGLALSFFLAVDYALGTSYYEEWKDKGNSRTVERHQSQMQLIAVTHHLGLVHIDEIQFMLSYKSQRDAPSFITLESLFNKLGIPVILSCTSIGRECLFVDKKRMDFTTVRRLVNNREFRFSTYRLSDPFFNEMFDALFTPQLCPNNKVPDEEFRAQFHFLSCGLPAVMTRLAYLHHETLCQLRAKYPEKAALYQTGDVSRLEKVFKRQFSLIAPALKNLRTGNEARFEEQIEKTEQGQICITNTEVQESREKRRKKEAKSTPINSTTPFGMPEPVLPIDPQDMSQYLAGEQE